MDNEVSQDKKYVKYMFWPITHQTQQYKPHRVFGMKKRMMQTTGEEMYSMTAKQEKSKMKEVPSEW